MRMHAAAGSPNAGEQRDCDNDGNCVPTRHAQQARRVHCEAAGVAVCASGRESGPGDQPDGL